MIDFKKFKKVEETDQYTVLQHDNGHEIKISHKGLSDSHRKELEKMPVHAASGGRMKGTRGAHRMKLDYQSQRAGHGVGPEASGKSGASLPSIAPNAIAIDPHKMPKTGFTEPADQGTRKTAHIPGAPGPHEKDDVSAGARNAYYQQTGKYPPCINSSCKSYGKPHPNCRCYGTTSEAGNFYLAEGGEVGGYCSAGDRPHQPGCEYYAEGSPTPVGDDSATQTAAPDMSDQQQAPPDASENQNMDTMAAPEPLTPQDHAQQETQDLMNHDAAIQSDINAGHIKPETYADLFEKRDTLGKIGTIFGLMVGGMGSGLAKQPNMLMEMMNKEIQNDLAAQQHSAENRNNLLRINQNALTAKAGANLSQAEANAKTWALSNMQANRLMLDHLFQQRSKLPDGSPQAAQFDQAMAILAPMVDKENASIAAKYALASAISRYGLGNGGSGQGARPAPSKKQTGAKAVPMPPPQPQGPSAANTPQSSPGFWDTVQNQGIFNAITPYLPHGGEEGTSKAANLPGPQQAQQPKGKAVNEPPDTGPIPQFSVDSEGVKRSQFLGSSGSVPGQITPGEVSQANEEIGRAHQFNDKIKLIHQNFGELWKNRSDANQALKYISSLGVNLEGIHVQPPDFTTWTEGSKNYFRAANRIRQELGVLVGNGALTHEQADSVMTNLIKQNDTPEDYKNVVNQVDGNLLSNLKTPVLEKYGKIRRPKVRE